MPIIRRFRVTVNGKVYEVEAEELTAAVAPPDRPESPPARPADERPTNLPPRPQAEGAAVEAPLPGVVLDVKVQVGQQVSFGQVLVILEAMKMENEITAPAPGVVQSVRVAPGDNVAQGDILVVLA
ncbi:MAG: biotin/lipoyl-binding protein [Firmicutes bacterium]|nr:biotin/lipoyl-binding protein [Bacillota bacterium]